jgi:hypothetical protein
MCMCMRMRNCVCMCVCCVMLGSPYKLRPVCVGGGGERQGHGEQGMRQVREERSSLRSKQKEDIHMRDR